MQGHNNTKKNQQQQQQQQPQEVLIKHILTIIQPNIKGTVQKIF